MTLIYADIVVLVAVLAILDPNIIPFTGLILQQFLLELRKIPLRIQLEIDILRLKHDKKRHMKMAAELRKELGLDE